MTHQRSKCSFALGLHYAPGYAERCQQALEEALYCTPAYGAWLKCDPGPEYPVFSRLAALPALTKADLRAHGPQGFAPHGRDVAAALRTGEIQLVATSGTTSDQVMNIWHQAWWNASEAASWQLNAHAQRAANGMQREAILTSPYCAGFPCEEGYLPVEQRRLDRFLFLSERSDPSTWTGALMDRMVAELNDFGPSILEANPSFLARLARHIVASKLRVHTPELVVLTYENPSLLHYRQIRRAFACPIASSYGSTEAGYVFMECEAGRLHQVTASCHVDFLPLKREHGGPDIGAILVTTFGNPWRSLLRFDIADLVRLAPTSCPCGRREGLTLASIEGRAANLTLTPEGRAVTQARVDRALSNAAGLAEYQLVQTGPAAYQVHFVPDGPAEPVAGAIRTALQGVYGPQAAITAWPVPAIAPAPPGKYRRTRAAWPIPVDALLESDYAPAALEEGHT